MTPILYLEDPSHSYLHQTLHEWSTIYRDGVLGKERIAAQCATSNRLLKRVAVFACS
ncbi:MAG: hypothetical protein ACXW3P_10165 [Rhodospirillales bacterium]